MLKISRNRFFNYYLPTLISVILVVAAGIWYMVYITRAGGGTNGNGTHGFFVQQGGKFMQRGGKVVIGGNGGATVVTAITLDATCTGTGGVCSSPMSVTAGDTLTCETSDGTFNPESLWIGDSTNNKIYDNVYENRHPNSANAAMTVAVLMNSAGGSITPYAHSGSNGSNSPAISCRAWKGTAVSNALDGGSVEQTNYASTASVNATSGALAAPTNDTEVVIGAMVRPTTATVSDASPWIPGSTITAVGSTYPLYDHYQIQGAATAANSPMTASSAKYIDSQYAILNANKGSGYRSLTGLYGLTSSQANGSSCTVATLSSSTVTSLHGNGGTGGWVLTGTAGVYDTTFSPTGTGKIMVQQSAHSFGDVGTGIRFSGAQTANYYSWASYLSNPGTPSWLSFFTQVDSSGITNNSVCDIAATYANITDNTTNLQALYNTTNGLYFFLEPFTGGSSAYLTGFSLDTPYWVQIHSAGPNDRYDDVYISSKSGSTWSQVGHLQYDVLCQSTGMTPCTTPPTVATPTGTASSGSTTLTLDSGASTANGQVVLDPTNNCLAWPTVVESGGGTATITLSQPTTCAISGTSVNFYQALANLNAATNGTASAGSTTLTIVAPGTGAIQQYDPIGGTNIAVGTFVANVAGTTITLSQPTTGAITNGGVSFWNVSNIGLENFSFGKFSSCGMASIIHFGSMVYDPLGTWGQFEPN